MTSGRLTNPTPGEPAPSASAGQKKRDTEARKQRDQSASVRDIGEIPEPMNPELRKRCKNNLKLFLEMFFPLAFLLEWSTDHERAIAAIQQAVTKRVKVQIILPRGFGKTTIGIATCIWCAIYGHSQYVVLLAATGELADELLEDVKTIFETNEVLHANFPEFTIPIRALEGMSNRCSGQTFQGVRTKIRYRKDGIVFAYLGEKYKHTGGVFRVGSLSGKAMRGFRHTKPDGSVIRPSFFFADDPQTDDSARSFTQTRKRLRLLQANIGGMAGPTESIGGVMACTIICPDDLTCQIMRNDVFEWLHIRASLVYQWPDESAAPLWEEYNDILQGCFRTAQEKLDDPGDVSAMLESLDLSPATEFYRENRAVMDNGAEVAWAARYVESQGEISALQYAYNLLFRLGEDIFEREYQNNENPLAEAGEALTREDILGDPKDLAAMPGRIVKTRKRGIIPATADHLVAYVDVHKKLLFWIVAAVERDGSQMHMVDYGVYPPQSEPVFRMSSARYTLRSVHRGCDEEAAILAGLKTLLDTGGKVRGQQWTGLLRRPYARDDGGQMHIELCPIDTGYAKDVVEKFCKETTCKSAVPAKGQGYGYNRPRFDEVRHVKKSDVRNHILRTAPGGEQKLRLTIIDTDWHKTQMLARLKTPPGDRGAFTIFAPEHRGDHDLLVTHWIDGEYFIDGVKDGVHYRHWDQPSSKPDNHWWDCLVGCYAAGNWLGCVHLGVPTAPRKRKKKKRRSRVTHFDV